jgi:hypothetical protein
MSEIILSEFINDILLPKLNTPPPGNISGLIESMINMVTPVPLRNQLWCESKIKLAFLHTCLILGVINVVHLQETLNRNQKFQIDTCSKKIKVGVRKLKAGYI